MATSVQNIEMNVKRVLPNPKLEAIRNEGLKDPEIEYDSTRLLNKTTSIHAGWLFNEKFLKLLHQICLFLDGNRESYNRPGWRHLGFELGLNRRVMDSIEFGNFGQNGYTYNVLLAFAQYEDSTLCRIIDVLFNMKRFDVINETHKLIETLVDSLSTSGDSGYCPDYSDFRENEYDRNIKKPDYIPEAPFVLQNPEKIVQFNTLKICEKTQNQPLIQKENIQTSDSARREISVEKVGKENLTKKYDCKIMLTFASDGFEFAENIILNLRKKRADGKTIGVLVFYEHLHLFERNPEEFIMASFHQVDYIIPIITEGYIRAAVDYSPPLDTPIRVDCQYVRFIYTLMTQFYSRNGCFNVKTRCVIPDKLIHLEKHRLMQEPIFRSWRKLSNIGEWSETMLEHVWKCRNM